MLERCFRRTLVVLALAAAGCGFDTSSELASDPGQDDTPDPPEEEPISACSDKAGSAGIHEWTFSIDGAERSARIYVPEGYDAEVETPVVLNFHGYGSYDEQQLWLSGLDERADDGGFITVHPQGTGAVKGWNAGSCCGSAADNEVDDVALVEAILDRLEDEHCVDTKRIYSTGMSNGGFMSYRLACELSHRIAAIAPVAGVSGMSECEPERAVSILHFHGTRDLVVPIGGSPTLDMPSVRDTLAEWARRNECAESTEEISQNGDATCYAFRECANESEVISCVIDGGGHTWPGGELIPAFGKTSQDISATDEMVEFFARHTLEL